MMSAKACTLSLIVLLVSLFCLAFLTSLGALLAYGLAFVSAAVTLLLVVGLERSHQFIAAKQRAYRFQLSQARSTYVYPKYR